MKGVRRKGREEERKAQRKKSEVPSFLVLCWVVEYFLRHPCEHFFAHLSVVRRRNDAGPRGAFVQARGPPADRQRHMTRRFHCRLLPMVRCLYDSGFVNWGASQ
jgi:hypothetical protein